MPTVQIAPIYREVRDRLIDFCVPKGVEIVEAFVGQGEDIPRLPNGQPKPHAILEIGDIMEIPGWSDVADEPGQLGLLDISIVLIAGDIDSLNVARDVVVTALDRYEMTDGSRWYPMDGTNRIPVESFLQPFKYGRTLGFMLTVSNP